MTQTALNFWQAIRSGGLAAVVVAAVLALLPRLGHSQAEAAGHLAGLVAAQAVGQCAAADHQVEWLAHGGSPLVGVGQGGAPGRGRPIN